MAYGEKLKVAQELLRYSNLNTPGGLPASKVEAKRTAQEHVQDLFLVDKAVQ